MTDKIFTLFKEDKNSRARTGKIDLAHGVVKTPVFMPVGTSGVVKAVDFKTLKEIGFEIILSNTYHLMLRPGMELIRNFGGLHKFNSWTGNILTDSGGFQVFSLSKIRNYTIDGVNFRSHIDGSKYFLTPEEAVDIQVCFNSDIQMALDICSSYKSEKKEILNAKNITNIWAKRAKGNWLLARDKGYQGQLFGIIQGGFDKQLREDSTKEILDLDLPGIAIGGLSVGEPFSIFADNLEHCSKLLPKDIPHYLMGIGTPEYIFEAVENGIDMFDCVFPTRTARNGLLFTAYGPISIKNQEYTWDETAADKDCNCRVCANFSRAFLRHLFKAKEIMFSMLASEHNLFFINDLVSKIRYNIEHDNFINYKKSFFNKYKSKN